MVLTLHAEGKFNSSHHLEGEIWYKIEGYEYLISTFGRVYGIKSKRIQTSPTVSLCSEKGRSYFKITTLLESLVPNKKPEHSYIVHKDGNSNNNRLDNLEWVSKEEYLRRYPRSTKGKNYQEIYGTTKPKCGFKKGQRNIAKRPDIREKISKGVKKSYTKELRNLRRNQAIERLMSCNKKDRFNTRQIPDKEGNLFRSSFEVEALEYLKECGIKFSYKKNYEQPVKIGNRRFLPDFVFDKTDILNEYDLLVHKESVGKKILVEVTGSTYKDWRDAFLEKLEYIIKHDKQRKYFIIVLTYPDVFHNYCFLNKKYPNHVHVYSFGDPDIESHTRTLTNNKFNNIDYTHFLPWHDRGCKQLHGHSSKLNVKIKGIFGITHDPWIIDFSILNKAIKAVCEKIDHKLILNRTDCHTLKLGKKQIKASIKTNAGMYQIEAPKETVTIVDFPTTVENLSFYIAKEIAGKLPDSIFWVEVEMFEGLGNSAKAVYTKTFPEVRNFLKEDIYKLFAYHVCF